MPKLLDLFFRDDETLSPRILVGSGLIAYALDFLRPHLGWSQWLIMIAIIFALGLVCYGALRALLPLMDPRDPDADRLVVWGSAVLCLVVGFEAFGLWFLPALVLGGMLIRWRAPELLEIIPGFEDREEKAPHKVEF